jgi:hypothetical protein
VSKKQHNFMAAVANNPAFAKKAGVPPSVGQEFVDADKKAKFGGGQRRRADLQKVNKPKTDQGKAELFSKGGDMKESKAMVKKEIGFMKKAGAPKSMVKHEMKEAGMKKGGTAKYANGGITTAKMGAVRTAAPSRDGVASKGKTKGTMVKMGAAKPLGMKYGGKC